MNKTRVGIIGAGAIARDHVRGCNSHAKAEVVAIADPSLERAKAVAKEFKIARVSDDPRDLIRDPDLDAISIAVPNKFHAPYALAALKAGKHVSLDKPFAMNAAEAHRVLAAAKAARKVFTLGMNWRFNKDAQTVRALVERGDLGDIYHARAYCMRRTGSPRFGTWFCDKKLAGGGALLDIGVHFLDMCLYLMGNFKPVAVSGSVYTTFGNRGIGEGGWGHSDPGKKVFTVDDFGTALIKLEDGASVQLSASWIQHMEQGNRMNVELCGTEAGATVSPARLLRFGKEPGSYELVEPHGVKIRYPHANRFHNWVDAIHGDAELEVKPQQALAVQKILDAIYASSKTGREVRIK